MNLPDAPIAHEGFFATHFFTVKDQEKSKDFYVRILGGKVVALKERLPDLIIVPSHEMRAFAEMSELSQAVDENRH